jgi:ankyrin repeat protein
MVKEWSRGCDPVVLLLMAISPATGDSVLHTAFIAQRLEMVSAINGMFRSHGLHFPARQFLILHSNNSGDTILHLAARSGLQKMVTAAYRVFHYDSLPDEERFSWPPAEEWDLGMHDEDRVPPLLFLVARNTAARDAADEAQHHGHDDIARFLRNLVERIDPLNSRSNPAEMCRMETFRRELYRME